MILLTANEITEKIYNDHGTNGIVLGIKDKMAVKGIVLFTLTEVLKAESKHVFRPSSEDKDFCDLCGNNFRNTDCHFSIPSPSEGQPAQECPRCHGEGEIEKNIPGNEGAPEMDVMAGCPECGGTGIENP